MQQKTKKTLVFVAVVALFIQTLFGSLPAMAMENLSPLHITMTTDGQLYNEGEIATSPVEVTVTTTSGDSAEIEISQDARTTWQPFNHTEPLVITEEGEHELWFRLADVEEKRIIKIDSQLVQPLQLMKTTTADSTTIYVDAKKSPGGNGESWTTAYNDLQQALDDAKAKLQVNPTTKLEIWVAAGTYKPTKVAGGTDPRNKTFQMQNNVAIYGGFNGTETELTARNWEQYPTILSGDIGIENNKSDNAFHVFYHPAGLNLNETAVLDGVTIKEGNANGMNQDLRGGGMYNNGSSPTLTNVTFSSNTAEYGGGLYNERSSPTLTNVVFSSNTGGVGGGLYNNSSSPTLMNVIFQSNEAYAGGGMHNDDSSPTLTNVTFSSNTAANNGGGMTNGNSYPTLTNVTFSSNTAANNGGGMTNGNSYPTLTNVTFSSNTAANVGGGMVNENNSSTTLMNVMFSSNTAANAGGGIANWDNSSNLLINVTMSGNKTELTDKGAIYGGNPQIYNSIIVGNNGEPALHSNVGGAIENSLLDVEENGEVVAKFSGEIQGETYTPEAIFKDPNQQDYQLRIKSPAIDRGQNILNRTQTDLAGNPRTQGSAIDLGAYEANFYDVIYKENGATVGDVPIGKMTYQQGETVTVQANSGSLERTGYIFTGWNTQADGEGTSYTANDTFQVTANITLYAQWTVNPTYTVTYDSNGATGGDIPEDMQRYEENTSVTVQGNSGNLTRTGYTFAGWNTQADGQGDSYTENDTFIMGTSNQILYAKWIPNIYKVIFEPNGGSDVAEQQVPYNEKAIAPPVPSKQGHTFAGWYTDGDEKWNFAVDVVTKDITLYAQWKVISNPPPTDGGSNPPPVSNDNDNNNDNNGNDYSPPAKVKITLHTNGGTAIGPIDIAYNTKISDLPIPTREGYRFDGWYQDKALTKPWAADTVLRENISLYAKWTALPVEEPQPQPEPEAPSPTVTFSDIERHWAKEMIEELASAGIIQGYEDGTFRPNESISRMHVAALLTRAFSFEQVRAGDDFKDVSSTHPYYEAIMTLQQAGIVDGTNGTFLPNEKMTRAQLAKVLVGLMGRTPEGTSSFTDVASTHWSAGYIAVLEQEGIALGDNGKFNPSAPVTRAQFVTFLYRVMQTIDS